jgi:bleomycin hydrolase
MKYLLTTLSLISSLFLASQVDLINKVKDNGGEKGLDFQMTSIYDLEALEVENQGRSSTCWSFSGTGFLESEYIRKSGKRIDLSALYVVRKVYEEKAEKYIRMHGEINFGQGGALPDVIHVLGKYGAIPQDIYKGVPESQSGINHDELEASLKAVLDAVLTKEGETINLTWKKAIKGLLDAYIGEVPESFKWEGKEYTPRSFADNYLDLHANEYLQFTSFTHHPFYQEMMIEVPDNWFWGTSWNLPLDEFMSLVDVSLEKGYTLAWATDVSEKGFSIRNGFAINPDYKQLRLLDIENPFIPGCPELNVDAVLRQKSFDNWETTDDHGMQIIGKVRDQNGKVYYTVRNSWGEIPNPYKPGYLYASESFIKHKSISFVVHKDILPKAIAKKLDL